MEWNLKERTLFSRNFNNSLASFQRQNAFLKTFFNIYCILMPKIVGLNNFSRSKYTVPQSEITLKISIFQEQKMAVFNPKGNFHLLDRACAF